MAIYHWWATDNQGRVWHLSHGPGGGASATWSRISAADPGFALSSFAMGAIHGSGPRSICTSFIHGTSKHLYMNQWDGVSWTKRDTGFTFNDSHPTQSEPSRDLWVFSPTDVYMVSAGTTDTPDKNGLIHFNGSTFTFSFLGAKHIVHGLWGFSPTHIEIANYADTGSDVISIGPSPFSHDTGLSAGYGYSIFGTSLTDRWALPTLEGKVYHYNGTSWSLVKTSSYINLYPNAMSQHRHIWGIDGKCWVVAAASWTAAYAEYYNGSSWSAVSLGGSTRYGRSIFGLDVDNVCAVGNRDGGAGGLSWFWDSATSSFVPNTNGLNEASLILTGIWGCIDQEVTPELSNQDPDEYDSCVELTKTVCFDLTDSGSGILDASTLIQINGVNAWASGVSCLGFAVSRTVITNGYRYTITPNTPFSPATQQSVRVYAQNNWGYELDETYTFRTAAAMNDYPSGQYCIELTDAKDLSIEDKSLVRDYSVASRCRMRLLTRRGGWLYDPTMGSRFHEIETLKDATRKVLPMAIEALQPLINEGAIEKVSVGAVETDPMTGLLAAEVFITIPTDDPVSLGFFQMGVS